MTLPRCRFCGNELRETFADLGMSPTSNAYVRADRLQAMEPFYPLHAWVCTECWLVQLEEFESPEELFSDYAYFSSFSDSWLKHAENYATAMIGRLGLGDQSLVVELASNDGYLLQYFRNRGVPVLGIDPAANVAQTAIAKGIPTEVAFFGRDTARRLVEAGRRADLLVGNNVLAHVPDINDFVAGMKLILARDGVITMEFPHLMRLIEGNQFDTIYHEHFSYLSLCTVERIFAHHGLTLFNVDELPTHGGSLRIYASHAEKPRAIEPALPALRKTEQDRSLGEITIYREFEARLQRTKRRLLEFLIRAKEEGKRIVGYGAPAKGNTLLNYCGIRGDFLDFTVDRSPHKQGYYLPGTHIPILHPDRIREARPDYLLILPWNLKDEIIQQCADIRSWGGKFLVPLPEVTVYE